MIYKETERVITCTRTDGKTVQVPAEKLVLRPAAYAILPHEGQILLVSTPYTSKYLFPGGQVYLGERVEQTLRRKLMEEAGIKVDVHQFCGFRERFFFDESINQAFHGLLFFYLCALRSQETQFTQQNEASGVKPHWVSIAALQAEDFQHSGGLVLEILNSSALPA